MFVETKTDGEAQQIGRDDFIAWLRTKRVKETFNFMNCRGGCAVGQYMAARGIKWSAETYCDSINQIFGGQNTCLTDGKVYEPQTFGALLQRMLALRAAS